MSLGSELIDDAYVLLNDDGTRYLRADLLRYLNESFKQIVAVRPDAKTARTTVDLVAGVDQTIPTTGLRLLKVIRNDTTTSKRAIGLVSAEVLDEFDPNWPAGTQKLEIQNYMHDPLSPKEFRVSPPAKVGAKAQVLYSVVPADITESDPYPMDATYEPATLDWICHRAYLMDIESPSAQGNAGAFLSMFNSKLGVKTTTDRATRPAAAQPARNIPSET